MKKLELRDGRAEDIRLQYAAIVESSNDAIIAKTLDGVISAWNPAAERIFGYMEHEAIGQPIAMIIPPELYDEEHDIRRRVRAGHGSSARCGSRDRWARSRRGLRLQRLRWSSSFSVC